jgi:hypothetical protein
MAGGWVLHRAGEYLDERWSPPTGNSMVGHFRWVRGGALWMTELLTITEEEGDVTFRLRHFSDLCAFAQDFPQNGRRRIRKWLREAE